MKLKWMLNKESSMEMPSKDLAIWPSKRLCWIKGFTAWSELSVLAGLRMLQIWCVMCTRMNYIRFKWTISLCVLKPKKNSEEFMYSMILHDQEYDHRPKISIRVARERAKTTSKYSLTCMRTCPSSVDSTRLDSHALASPDFDSSSDWKHTHRGSIERVQHNVQTCYWNSLSWDFAECASWNFFRRNCCCTRFQFVTSNVCFLCARHSVCAFILFFIRFLFIGLILTVLVSTIEIASGFAA